VPDGLREATGTPDAVAVPDVQAPLTDDDATAAHAALAESVASNG
jgi:hypothetical protein